MNAQIIDGVALSNTIRESLTTETLALKAKGITPGLAVILVGDNPASQVYVRNKVKACAQVGIHSVLDQHPSSRVCFTPHQHGVSAQTAPLISWHLL